MRYLLAFFLIHFISFTVLAIENETGCPLSPGDQANHCTNLTDPTAPISPDAPIIAVPDNSLNVEAIFFAEQNSRAIINGTSVGLHDKIGAYQIIDITKENVQLKGENGIVTLTIDTLSVKKN